MRSPKFLKPLLLSALLTAAVASPAASATHAYFSNQSGQSGVVDVYVDGKLVFDNVFPNFVMMFPRELAAGTHQVVVTPFALTPGEGDILQTTVTIPEDGTHTLLLGETQDELGVSSLNVAVYSGNAQTTEGWGTSVEQDTGIEAAGL